MYQEKPWKWELKFFILCLIWLDKSNSRGILRANINLPFIHFNLSGLQVWFGLSSPPLDKSTTIHLSLVSTTRIQNKQVRLLLTLRVFPLCQRSHGNEREVPHLKEYTWLELSRVSYQRDWHFLVTLVLWFYTFPFLDYFFQLTFYFSVCVHRFMHRGVYHVISILNEMCIIFPEPSHPSNE